MKMDELWSNLVEGLTLYVTNKNIIKDNVGSLKLKNELQVWNICDLSNVWLKGTKVTDK